MKKIIIALLVIAAAYAVGAAVFAVANGQAEGKVMNSEKQLLTDGDMEESGTDRWTPAGGVATDSKESGGPEDGKQYLKVLNDTGGSASNLFVYQSNRVTVGNTYRIRGYARGDGTHVPKVALGSVSNSVSLTTSANEWQYFDVVSTAVTAATFYLGSQSVADGGYVEFDNVYLTDYIGKQTNAESQMLVDGDMEASGTGSWTAGNGATLSKESGAVNDGSQVLRIAYNGTENPYATQNVLTVGKTYRLTGWARSDGTGDPRIKIGDIYYWNGETSTDWQRFDFVVTSESGLPVYRTIISEAGYTEWDDLVVTEYTAPATQNYVQLWTDGDMETADTSAWSELGGASVTKESAVRDDGTLALRVTASGAGSPGTHQDVFEVGKRYRMTGWTRTDSSRTVSIGDRSLAGGCVSMPATGASWTRFDCTFTAGHVGARLGFSSTAASQWAEFDDVLAVEL